MVQGWGILMGVIMLLTAVPPLRHGAAHGVRSATVTLCIDMPPLSTRRIVGLSLYYPRLPLIPFSPAPYINNEHMSRAAAIGRFWPHIG